MLIKSERHQFPRCVWKGWGGAKGGLGELDEVDGLGESEWAEEEEGDKEGEPRNVCEERKIQLGDGGGDDKLEVSTRDSRAACSCGWSGPIAETIQQLNNSRKGSSAVHRSTSTSTLSSSGAATIQTPDGFGSATAVQTLDGSGSAAAVCSRQKGET
ncbi:hypothetical protein SLEP1_g29441 [Rubroshorea leprosula]|uniref:Uncharacterized protein n=1 Tax=Rubroshorea leprosula TaxID=152421 RepID=A0AAV5JWV0_9ROSI|nr:hypothetical protein SLEP1_g29441 [Rubroshorea leprosula]